MNLIMYIKISKNLLLLRPVRVQRRDGRRGGPDAEDPRPVEQPDQGHHHQRRSLRHRGHEGRRDQVFHLQLSRLGGHDFVPRAAGLRDRQDQDEEPADPSSYRADHARHHRWQDQGDPLGRGPGLAGTDEDELPAVHGALLSVGVRFLPYRRSARVSVHP